MADPSSVFSIISASTALALQCGKVINELHHLSERYRYAGLTINSMRSSLEAVRWTWCRIDQILQEWTNNEGVWQDCGAEVITQLTRSLKSGSLVISALEKDLGPWANNSEQVHLGFGKKAKVIWNERVLKGHQERLRDQVNSMNLLISVIQM